MERGRRVDSPSHSREAGKTQSNVCRRPRLFSRARARRTWRRRDRWTDRTSGNRWRRTASGTGAVGRADRGECTTPSDDRGLPAAGRKRTNVGAANSSAHLFDAFPRHHLFTCFKHTISRDAWGVSRHCIEEATGKNYVLKTISNKVLNYYPTYLSNASTSVWTCLETCNIAEKGTRRRKSCIDASLLEPSQPRKPLGCFYYCVLKKPPRYVPPGASQGGEGIGERMENLPWSDYHWNAPRLVGGAARYFFLLARRPTAHAPSLPGWT